MEDGTDDLFETSADRALRLLRAGRAEDALPFFLDAVARQPSASLFMGYGRALAAAGLPRLATECFAAASERDPAEPDYARIAGAALARAGRFRESADRYAAVLAARPDDTAARLQFARCFYALGEFDSARREALKCLESGGHGLAAVLLLQCCYEELGLWAEAARIGASLHDSSKRHISIEITPDDQRRPVKSRNTVWQRIRRWGSRTVAGLRQRRGTMQFSWEGEPAAGSAGEIA
jgi:tetratricopeptide (TPR) repeat protein